MKTLTRWSEHIFNWLNKLKLIWKKVRNLSLPLLVKIKGRRSNYWLWAKGRYIILVLWMPHLAGLHEMRRDLANWLLELFTISLWRNVFFGTTFFLVSFGVMSSPPCTFFFPISIYIIMNYRYTMRVFKCTTLVGCLLTSWCLDALSL
jgi:hypothetical protein